MGVLCRLTEPEIRERPLVDDQSTDSSSSSDAEPEPVSSMFIDSFGCFSCLEKSLSSD